MAWALIGYFLTGLRQLWKLSGDGPDSLYLAAILSVLMVVISFFQLPTEPKPAGNPLLEALAMLRNYNYLLFILFQLVVSGMMQFYFLGTGQFMQDQGISGRNVSAAMGIAQAMQAAATILLVGLASKVRRVPVDVRHRRPVLVGPLRDVYCQQAALVDRGEPGVSRLSLRVLHDWRADFRQHHGSHRKLTPRPSR